MDLAVVTKVVVCKDQQVLILKRSSDDTLGPGEWDLPGGKLELAEDPALGAIRETNEETGLEVYQLLPLLVHSQRSGYTIMIIFKAVTDQTEIKLSNEHDEYKWVDIESFDHIDISGTYKKAISLL